MNKFKRAKPEDADFLTKLLRRSKAHWGYPQKWMDEWQNELTIESDYIDSNVVVMLEYEEKVIGFYGLEFENDYAYLKHLWLEPSHIGNGLGKILFLKVCEEAIEYGYSTMELHADPNAEAFYRFHGADKIGEVNSNIFGTPRVLPRMRVNLSSIKKKKQPNT